MDRDVSRISSCHCIVLVSESSGLSLVLTTSLHLTSIGAFKPISWGLKRFVFSSLRFASLLLLPLSLSLFSFLYGFFNCSPKFCSKFHFTPCTSQLLKVLKELYPVLSYLEICVILGSSHMSDNAWKRDRNHWAGV